MKKILVIAMILAFISGCSSKKSKDSFFSSTPSVEFCKNGIEKDGDSTIWNMGYEDFKTCKKVLVADSKDRAKNADLSRFGVQAVYKVDLQRDLRELSKILQKVYKYQLYVDDAVKFATYDRVDVHEDISMYIDLIEQNENLRADESGFERLFLSKGYNPNNFKFEGGKWWATGDCETTYRAIETFAIRAGINPQRIYEVFADVMTDASLVTPAGGHMFGFYAGIDGVLYTLEQRPATKTLTWLVTQRFYKPNEFRRADKAISDFKIFPSALLEKVKHGEKIYFKTDNEER